jgi:hypothetical protein
VRYLTRNTTLSGRANAEHKHRVSFNRAGVHVCTCYYKTGRHKLSKEHCRYETSHLFTHRSAFILPTMDTHEDNKTADATHEVIEARTTSCCGLY